MVHKNITRTITALLVVVAIGATYLFWAWGHSLKPGEDLVALQHAFEQATEEKQD